MMLQFTAFWFLDFRWKYVISAFDVVEMIGSQSFNWL